jgi:transcription initiation factor TFIIIB Brf1 subunit/transcription initiation factor TFIIB
MSNFIQELIKCPECENPVICDDYQSICSVCGLIIDEKFAASSKETNLEYRIVKFD